MTVRVIADWFASRGLSAFNASSYARSPWSALPRYNASAARLRLPSQRSVASPDSFEGQSILSAVNGRLSAASGPPIYFEAMDANLTRNWAPLTGIVSGGYKLIDLPSPELYDLSADQHETTNLFSREGERARTLEALLRSETARLASRAAAPGQVTLSAESRQRLQALGYVASSADPRHRAYTEADDPKTLIGAANDLDRALGRFKSGARADAMAAVRTIMSEHPRFSTPYGVFASMQHDTGDLAGAIRTLEDVVRHDLADQSVMVVLAGYLQEAGALEQSATLLEAVIDSHPDYVEAYNSLGVAYSRLGRHDRAQAALANALDLDPTSARTYENIGVDDFQAGRLDAAVAHLKEALDLDPALPGAHNALAAVYQRQGRRAAAISEWQTTLRLDPASYDALYNVGVTLYDGGQRDDARPYLQRFVAEAPAARYARDVARIRRLLVQ